MKKRLSIILCLAMLLCMMPTTSALAAKAVKAKSVSISPKGVVLSVGDIAQLSAAKKPSNATGKLTWTTSDAKVATVSSKGVVTGVSEGTATITVATSNKKKASCTVVVREYMTEADLNAAIDGLKGQFATKDDITASISQNTYTKSEIDEKIGSISVSEACSCIIKTSDDVLSIIRQNTYTKGEIDQKIAAISSGESFDWEDGMELQCLSPVPVTLEKKFWYRGEYHPYSVTINSITVKKYRYMDYYYPNSDNSNYYYFVPYMYDISVSYKIDNPDGFFESTKISPDLSFGYLEVDIPLDAGKNEASFSRYSLKDSSVFFVNVDNPEIEYEEEE